MGFLIFQLAFYETLVSIFILCLVSTPMLYRNSLLNSILKINIWQWVIKIMFVCHVSYVCLCLHD